MKNSIGVFDSGIGGLTVLKELAQAFPEESFLYLGDTARLPYGNKSPETIRKYALENMDYLHKQGVKAIIIACNSASSQVPEKEYQGIPVFNVIEPGAELAIKTTQNNIIGVLGTRATVHSQAYQKLLYKLKPNLEVYSQSCPMFVPLAEEGWIDDPITNLIVFRYMQSILQRNVDTIILGCTHYPILRDSVQRVAGTHIKLVDSGVAVSQKLKLAFENKIISKSSIDQKQCREIKVLATDLTEQFQIMSQKILNPVNVNKFIAADVFQISA